MSDPRLRDGKELPQWKSHKQVGALEIAHVTDAHDGHRIVSFADATFGDMKCPENMFTRFEPGPGDFLVAYEDGYKSFSPRQVFLDGYKRL
jgi:hypothetical protein